MKRKIMLFLAALMCIGLTACAVLAKPQNVTGGASQLHTLNLSWDAVEDATGYRIDLRIADSKAVLLRTTSAQNFTTLTNVPYYSGGYRVTVTALQEKGGKVTESNASEELTVAAPAVNAGQIETLYSQAYPEGNVLLSWSAKAPVLKNVDGSEVATRYEVWYSDSENGKYQLLAGDLSDPTFVDREFSFPRFYKVRVVRTIDGSKASGELSTDTACCMLLKEAVTGVNAQAENGAALLTWNAYENAVSYRVYEGKTLLAEGITECSYRHEGLTDLTTYDFRVEAVCSRDGDMGISPAGETSITMPLQNLPNVKASSANTSSIDIKWEAWPAATVHSGAAAHVNIYTAASAGGEMKLLAEKITDSSFRHGELSSGSTHYYQVELVVTLNGKTYTAMSETVKATVMVPVSDGPFMGTEWICDRSFLLHKGAAHQMSGFSETNAKKMAAAYDAYAGLFPNTRVSVVVGPISSLVIADEVKGVWNQQLDKNASLQTDRVNFVNLKQTFLDHKDEYLFFKSDHHWTHRGAYYAYQQFALSAGLTPRAVEDFEVKILNSKFIGSMAGFTKDARVKKFYDTVEAYLPSKACTMTYGGKTVNYCINTGKTGYTAFIDGDISYGEITVPENPQDMVAVVLKDSYGNAFVPYLTEHYGKIYVIDPRYASFTIQQKFAGVEIDDIIFCYNNYSANSSAWVGYLNKLIGK